MVFKRDFMQICNFEVFLESITIASACNELLRKRFLKTDTIDLMPVGGYSGNVTYSKKALMWLVHMEQLDGVKIKHARKCRECRLPELPRYSVDGYCSDNRIMYELLGCFWHGCVKCQTFRDIPTMNGDTLVEGYERTMSRLEQMTRVGYQVKVEWECEIDNASIVKQKPELLTHPIVRQSPLCTRDAWSHCF